MSDLKREERSLSLEDLDEAVRRGEITARQAMAIRFLRERVLLSDGLGPDHVRGYEYKKFEASLSRIWLGSGWGRWMLCLMTEVGPKKDEKTAASLFCRTRRVIFIGRRGALNNCLARSKARSRGRWAYEGQSS